METPPEIIGQVLSVRLRLSLVGFSQKRMLLQVKTWAFQSQTRADLMLEPLGEEPVGDGGQGGLPDGPLIPLSPKARAGSGA